MRIKRRSFPFLLALALALLLSGEALAAPMLQQGSEGHDVLILQQRLKSLGYEVEADGVFGYSTYRAVIAFQRDEKLTISGKVDRASSKSVLPKTNRQRPRNRRNARRTSRRPLP